MAAVLCCLGHGIGKMASMFRERPVPDDPNIRPVIRDPYDQVYAAHWRRIAVYACLQVILGSFPFFIAAFLYWSPQARLFSPSCTLAWFCYQASQALAMYGRYNCTFCSNVMAGSATFLPISSISGLLAGAVFVALTPSRDLAKQHYLGLLLATALVSSLISAGIFLKRGYDSSRGEGMWKKPSAQGYGRGPLRPLSPLLRGFDQVLPSPDFFINPPPSSQGGGPLAPVVPTHGRWLLPPVEFDMTVWDWVPAWAHPLVKAVAKQVFYRTYLLLERSEIQLCFLWSVITLVSAALFVELWHLLGGPILRLLNLDSGALLHLAGFSWPFYGMSDAFTFWTRALQVFRVLVAAMLVQLGTSLNTLVLYHILLQPLNYGQFTTLGGPVLKPWLEKGYELALTPVADARKQQDLVVKEEAIWVTEKEEHDQVLFRLAALANPASFPPRVDLYSRISVTDRMNRALAFQDLAILAATSAGRRKWIYYDRRLWTACSNPAIAVINALTLQLELQVEAESRVEGGPASPRQHLHTRLGVVEPREAESLAKLIVESEVLRRHEQLLRQQERDGVPITELPETPILPRTTPGLLGWPKRTLTKLRIPSIEVQVVECAVRALGSFFENSIQIEKGTKQFEDFRSSSRSSIPSAVVALLSLQLAVHLYSATALGDPQRLTTATTHRLHDRPSTVIAPLLRLSLCIDKSLEKIIYNFYETDFHAWGFAPIYAKCLQAYVRGLLRDPQPGPSGSGQYYLDY